MNNTPDTLLRAAGLPPDHLRRYRAARARIDPEIRLIHSLTALLAKFEEFDRDRVTVDPVALGVVHSRLEQSVLAIWRELDEFLLVEVAKKEHDDGQSD